MLVLKPFQVYLGKAFVMQNTLYWVFFGIWGTVIFELNRK